MFFVRDLFPRQQATPAAVASGIAEFCTVDAHRNEDPAIREVVRTAHEWQSNLKPPKKMFKPPAPRATEADFLSAARQAYERFG